MGDRAVEGWNRLQLVELSPILGHTEAARVVQTEVGCGPGRVGDQQNVVIGGELEPRRNVGKTLRMRVPLSHLVVWRKMRNRAYTQMEGRRDLFYPRS